ncbi:MAG: multidrug transporter [Deltaproteobacteria bacterium]|nr:multidrug transporter [Deltaproteobacteria bacterium]
MSELTGWRKRLAPFLSALFLWTAFPATAQDPYAEPLHEESPSGGMMMFDIVFLRPFGLLATALGTATFLVSLPFTVAAGGTGHAGKTLVVEPVLYTFDRPLGRTERGH